MASTRGQFPQLLAFGLTKIMFDFLREHPEEYSQFCYVEPSTGAYDEDQIYSGLGLARIKREGTPVSFDDPIEGGSKRYIHDSYALGWQVTREMRADDRYDIMRRVPAQLIKSARQTVEIVAANVLNLSFTTIITADGVSFINTAHPLLGDVGQHAPPQSAAQGVYPNRLSPDQDVSVTALQDMLILYENMVDNRGLRVRLSPEFLYHPPELQFIIQRTLQSQFLPGTGDNDINPVQGRVMPVLLHYLTSPTAWWMGPKNNMDNYLKLKWREKYSTEVADDVNTKGTKHDVFFRISASATHWPGWVGSNP